jgi:hypothetical protein
LTELFDEDFLALARHVCPDCGHKHFYRGPQGGLALNVGCASCGNRFNVTVVHGELLFAQRIGNADYGEWPDRGFW